MEQVPDVEIGEGASQVAGLRDWNALTTLKTVPSLALEAPRTTPYPSTV
jgi:hypothetical protein